MEHLLQYFWLLLIAATLLQAARWWSRGRPHRERNPALTVGYRRLTRGLAIWGNIPWLVMGVGLLSGGVGSMDDYLRLKEADPWVIAWYATVGGLWVLLLYWLFRRHGAQAIVEHPGLLRVPLSQPWQVKLPAVGAVIAGVVAILFLTGGRLPGWSRPAGGGYTTVFTVYDGFCRIAAVAGLFALVGVGAMVFGILWLRRLRLPQWWRRKEASGPTASFFVAVLFLVLAALHVVVLVRDYHLVRVYRTGSAPVAEGTVRVLHEQPEGGHDPGDRVEIGGAPLVINYFVVTPTYTRTIAHGGALREGTAARVWYHGDQILRVDVRR